MKVPKASVLHLTIGIVGVIGVLTLGTSLTLMYFRGIFAPAARAAESREEILLHSAVYAEETARTAQIRFFMQRVRHDPDDFVAQNMLASQLLQQVRATGNGDALGRAVEAARVSLRSVPAARNPGGLSALARAEMAEHDFGAAKKHAEELTALDPGTLEHWGVLVDALLELGEYQRADHLIHIMRALGENTAETEIRMGRMLFLQGDTPGATKHFFRALAFANHVSPPVSETVAWCHWQLGEAEWASGHLEAAEQAYRRALETSPAYPQALASLGRVRAARGDIKEAIEAYQRAIHRYPDPTFVAALGDLYRLNGREEQAASEYELVENIAHLSALNGVRFNRQIALFYADHDLNAAIALQNAEREYVVRKDIYGADALAWTALKAGNLVKAHSAIEAALQLSTQDPKILYHAGLIAAASRNREKARNYLRHALDLNPGFDPLQAKLAREVLKTL